MQRPGAMLRLIGLGAVLLLAVSACGGQKSSGGGGGGATKQGGTMVFAASSDPVSLDPAFISDGESIRLTNQIYEGLVKTKPGSTEIEPSLAKSWTSSNGAKTWTFELQQGVKFHDGTPFNAAAVCANFDRWYNFKGLLQSDSVSYYWVRVFGGFSDKKTPSLYQSCEAKGDNTAVPNATLVLKTGSGLQYQTADATGQFLFEYVPRDPDNGLSGGYILTGRSTTQETTR